MVLAGLGMCIGNMLGGKLSDLYTPGRVAAVTQGVMCLALLMLFFWSANPMALSYANTTVEGDEPSVSYATVYPLSMFIRVISAQLLIMLFT